MTKIDPRLRISLYLLLCLAGGLLVTWGIVTQDFVNALIPVAGGALGIAAGGVAAKNVPAVRETPPELREWIVMARDSLPAILNEVARLRAEVASRSATDVGLPAPELVEYVPDRAPWLPPAQEYVGEHRLEG